MTTVLHFCQSSSGAPDAVISLESSRGANVTTVPRFRQSSSGAPNTFVPSFKNLRFRLGDPSNFELAPSAGGLWYPARTPFAFFALF